MEFLREIFFGVRQTCSKYVYEKKIGRYSVSRNHCPNSFTTKSLFHSCYPKMHVNTHSLAQFVQNLIRKSYLKTSHDFFLQFTAGMCNAASVISFKLF